MIFGEIFVSKKEYCAIMEKTNCLPNKARSHVTSDI